MKQLATTFLGAALLYAAAQGQPEYIGTFVVDPAGVNDTVMNFELPSYGKFIYKVFNPDTSADGLIEVGHAQNYPPWYRIYFASCTVSFYTCEFTEGWSYREVEVADSSLFAGDYQVRLHYRPEKGTQNTGTDSVQVYFEQSDIMAGAQFLISIISGGTEQNSVETTFTAAPNSFIVAHAVQRRPWGGGHSIYIDNLGVGTVETGQVGGAQFYAFKVPAGEHTLRVAHEDDYWGDNQGPRQVDIYLREGGCSYTPADVNGNGTVNVVDITALVNWLVSSQPPACDCDCPPHQYPFYACADVNGNCAINVVDITALVNWLVEGNPPPSFCADCPPAE